MIYNVKKVEHSFKWDDVEIGKINVFNWNDFKGYDPDAEFRMVHDENNIYLKMTANNDYVVSECKNINDMVCGDSCMEAFIIAPGESGVYFNLEFNSDGVMFLGAGKTRANRSTIDPEIVKKYITIMVDPCTVKTGERGKWGFTAIVNKGLFKKITDVEFESGRGQGSFYKCGDRVIPHFVAWTEIETDHPDFHRPEFFGDLIFE